MGLEFDDEPASDRLNPVDCVGHLLLVWAIGYTDHSPTKYTVEGKKSDVVHVDCVDLDLADDEGYAGKLFRNCWWRNGRLIGFLRPRIGRGKPVLAWMTKGVATMGQPPYELSLATGDEDAIARGQAWIQAHPEFTPTGFGGQSGGNMGVSAGVRTEAVSVEMPQQRQKSQLEQLAERNMAGKAAHLATLDAASAIGRPPLPPPPPPRPAGTVAPPQRASSYDEKPPF